MRCKQRLPVCSAPCSDNPIATCARPHRPYSSPFTAKCKSSAVADNRIWSFAAASGRRLLSSRGCVCYGSWGFPLRRTQPCNSPTAQGTNLHRVGLFSYHDSVDQAAWLVNVIDKIDTFAAASIASGGSKLEFTSYWFVPEPVGDGNVLMLSLFL